MVDQQRERKGGEGGRGKTCWPRHHTLVLLTLQQLSLKTKSVNTTKYITLLTMHKNNKILIYN